MLFKDASNTTSFAKVGILGFAGSGKTRTATEIAVGLHKAIKSTKPIGFMDSETGSDFVLPIFQKHGIKLMVSKTRAFKDLAEGIKEAPSHFDILIIDSVSHFWVDIVESYRAKKNVNRLSFQDWGIIKPMWNNDFSTPFVTSALHIIVCGRAGFEYDYFEGEDGKMELYKTGTKMKAETEFGFEPSLLIEMERIKNPEATEEYRTAKTKDAKMKASKQIMAGREFVRKAMVLKDRSDIMDGKVFYNPTYVDFADHWQSINIGGEHKPLEPGNSTSLFDIEGKPQWARDQQKRKIAMEEIEGELTRVFPGQSKEEKRAKGDMIEYLLGTRSWTKVETLHADDVDKASKRAKVILSQQANVDILLSNTKPIKDLSLIEPKEDIPELSRGNGENIDCPSLEKTISAKNCEKCHERQSCPSWPAQ